MSDINRRADPAPQSATSTVEVEAVAWANSFVADWQGVFDVPLRGDTFRCLADAFAAERAAREKAEADNKALSEDLEKVQVALDDEWLKTAVAEARAERAEAALRWYEEQVRNCRKLPGIPEGEQARSALDNDGGQRALAALAGASGPVNTSVEPVKNPAENEHGASRAALTKERSE